jgi:quinol monooxygenase YgiN
MPKIWKIARYTVKSEEELDAVLTAVDRFVAAVGEHEPETFYDAWQEVAEPLRFVHVMGFADAAAEQRHRKAPYTLEFVEALYPRCREEPAFRDLKRVRRDA